jgi:hypothetical protein
VRDAGRKDSLDEEEVEPHEAGDEERGEHHCGDPQSPRVGGACGTYR